MYMKQLFDQTEIKGLKLKNRIFRSATWEGLANEDGSITIELEDIYIDLAKGGVGAIITGYTSPSSVEHDLPWIMRLADDSVIPAYKQFTEKIKAYNCAILAQLCISSYHRAIDNRKIEIDQLEENDIKAIIDMFVKASVRAKKSGFDGVQIHVAHGFFLSRFVSPAYNHRQDAYGGSPEKRAKIIIDILKAVRQSTNSDFHISMKVNCSDFLPNGLTPPESLIICQEAAENGIDSIEISGNGTSRTGIKPTVNEAYFLEFALVLKQLVDTPLILVGGHRSVESMNDILQKIEYISLSRPLIREPDLPNRWKNGDLQPSSCISCNGCYHTHGHLCRFNH